MGTLYSAYLPIAAVVVSYHRIPREVGTREGTAKRKAVAFTGSSHWSQTVWLVGVVGPLKRW